MMKTRIKEHRKRLRLTQEQVAAKAGLSQPYYAQIESGSRQMNERLMVSLSKVFGVSMTELLPGASEAERLARLIMELSPEDRAVIMTMAERLASKPTAE